MLDVQGNQDAAAAAAAGSSATPFRWRLIWDDLVVERRGSYCLELRVAVTHRGSSFPVNLYDTSLSVRTDGFRVYDPPPTPDASQMDTPQINGDSDSYYASQY